MAIDKEREALGNMIDAFGPRDYKPDIMKLAGKIQQKVHAKTDFSLSQTTNQTNNDCLQFDVTTGSFDFHQLLSANDMIRVIEAPTYEKQFIDMVAQSMNNKVDEMLLKNLDRDGYTYDFVHNSDEPIDSNELFKVITKHVDDTINKKRVNPSDYSVSLLIHPSLMSRIPSKEMFRSNELFGYKYTVSTKAPKNTVKTILVNPEYIKDLFKDSPELSLFANSLLESEPVY